MAPENVRIDVDDVRAYSLSVDEAEFDDLAIVGNKVLGAHNGLVGACA